MTEKKQMYNVVFRYTALTGGYEGVMTWTGYPSKEDFDKYRDELLEDGRQVVEAEGVSDEEATSICMRTPLECRIRAAEQEATESGDGCVNVMVLEMQMLNILSLQSE